jgi:hypothetical protein
MPVLTATEYEVIPRGAYNAIVTQIETKVADSGPRAGEDYLAWTLEVLDGEHAGAKIRANSSYKLGPKTKTRRWVESILDRQLGKGEQLHTDAVVHQKCVLRVVQTDKDGVTFNEIDAVLPLFG